MLINQAACSPTLIDFAMPLLWDHLELLSPAEEMTLALDAMYYNLPDDRVRCLVQYTEQDT